MSDSASAETGRGAFAGTAESYLRFRAPYPEALLQDLRAHAGTSGRGALLDLACGPGRVAIPMAPHFARVVAVDVEAEMIAVGEREAVRRGVATIDWRSGRAEDLVLAPGSIELITIGDAFHRLDGPLIVERARRWLEPNGALATLGSEQPYRRNTTWQRALVAVVNRWTDDTLGDPNTVAWGGPVDLLRAAGFDVVEREMTVEWVWSCDALVGWLYSTSFASRRALGTDVDAFEAELRAALLACEPSGKFVAPQRFGFTCARAAPRRF